jgi:NuA3 HAT complex component NTO1
MKLDEKYYTSVQTFSEDMAAVFSAGVDFATITNVQDAENQLSGVAHSSLTSEQKEKKKLAKRIIKVIKPLYEDALRKESDLAGRPFEKILDLETLLDQNLARRLNSASGDGSVQPTTEVDGFGNMDGDIAEDEDAAGEEDTERTKEDDHIHLAPTPDDNLADHHGAEDEAADDAAIAAQLSQDSIHASTHGQSHNEAMEIDHEGASGAGVAPLTPPRSEKDLLAPLANGGLPWYMDPFDISGTTIHDEVWSQEVGRALSEDLSELDDDELNGLADLDDVSPTDGAAPETNVSDAQRKAKQKKRRNRW